MDKSVLALSMRATSKNKMAQSMEQHKKDRQERFENITQLFLKDSTLAYGNVNKKEQKT